MKKTLPLLFVLCAIAGCAHTPSEDDASDDSAVVNVVAENSAKIRVFNADIVHLHPGKSCWAWNNEGRITASLTVFSRWAPNIKVGMPKPADIPKMYAEYVVPAGQPLTVEITRRNDAGGVIYTCGPVAVTFKPEVNKYYDTSMLHAASRCAVRVRELIETTPGKADPTLVETTPADACSASANFWGRP